MIYTNIILTLIFLTLIAIITGAIFIIKGFARQFKNQANLFNSNPMGQDPGKMMEWYNSLMKKNKK